MTLKISCVIYLYLFLHIHNESYLHVVRRTYFAYNIRFYSINFSTVTTIRRVTRVVQKVR